jgi:hypothetical protein
MWLGANAFQQSMDTHRLITWMPFAKIQIRQWMSMLFEGWALAWEQAAESVPEFRLSVRLLRTGINYVKASGNQPGILLDLTSPERAILEQALGLAKRR